MKTKTITIFCSSDGHYWIEENDLEKLSGVMSADSSMKLSLVCVDELKQKLQRIVVDFKKVKNGSQIYYNLIYRIEQLLVELGGSEQK